MSYLTVKELEMEIGELLQKYRIEQGKTQKSWAGNVISPSFYSKVEKGLNRISAEDLLRLLEANHIPLWEFFSHLEGNADQQKKWEKNLRARLMQAYYHGNQADFQQLFKEVQASNFPDKEEQLLIIEGWMETIKDDQEANEALRQKIKDKIFNIAAFDKKRLMLYCNFMDFYDLESNRYLSRQIVEKYRQTTDVDIQVALLAIIDNLLTDFAEKREVNGTEYFIEAGKQIPTRPELFFYKNSLLFFENLLAYQAKPSADKMKYCRLAVQNYQLLGMAEYGQEVQKFLDEHM